MTELLSPAGSVEALDAAIGEGADAVYLGLKSFNARLRSTNFAWREFEATVQNLHRMGKKIYVTVNTVSEEKEMERLYRFLSYLDKVHPDGLIVQDFGVVRMCQEFFPDLELHASTQMNVESAAAANLLCREGFKRVVLARELGLSEIKAVKEHSGAELEVFVHGALCVSESGLCLFSSYLGGKSANRGMCTQACRRIYTVDSDSGEHKGYYFSPSDLQLIEQVPDLMSLGVNSFKIEGRMKSAEYVGAVTAAYRYVMDHWEQDKRGAIAEGKRILSTDFARSKTNYWYGFSSEEEGIKNAGAKILNPNQAGGTGIYLGTISELRPATDEEKKDYLNALGPRAPEENAPGPQEGIQMALIKGGDYDPDPGDSIRLHRRDDTGRESHKVRVISLDEKGRRWIDIPKGFTRADSVYLLQTKAMSKRYKRVLTQDLSLFRRQPGAERLPVLDLTPLAKDELKWFPEGFYVQVSTVADAHLVQGLHPVRIILELNKEVTYDLLHKGSAEKPLLQFSKKMTVLSLDPFVPEGSADELQSTLDTLVEMGYSTFIVNNLAHITMLRGKKDVHMIAGPYLYTFNKWAVSFIENQNIMAVQTPLENGSENLEDTFATSEERSRVLLCVFGYPPLFRMRFQLPESYDFTYFADKEDMTFKVVSSADGAVVMPESPFSLLDKIDALRSKGWKRLLLDFSRTKVVKTDVRDIMNVMQNRSVISGSSRFNWKNGFYDPEKMEAYQAMAEKAAARKNEQRKRSGKPGNRSYGSSGAKAAPRNGGTSSRGKRK